MSQTGIKIDSPEYRQAERKARLDTRDLAETLSWQYDREILFVVSREAVYRAAQKYTSSRGASFATFATRVSKNAVYNEIRAQQNRSDCMEPLEELDPETTGESPDLDTQVYVRSLLEKLDTRERVIVTRYYLQGENICDIARDFGLTPSWTGTVIKRSLEIMREYA
jgi:RNA polymerase sigma factor (sigma-70 family)